VLTTPSKMKGIKSFEVFIKPKTLRRELRYDGISMVFSLPVGCFAPGIEGIKSNPVSSK
jgi:hypothetical protein